MTSILILVAWSLATGGIMPPAAPAIKAQYSEAFGYRLGEERRYILEPDKALRPGEHGMWRIRFEDVDGEGEDLRFIFNLEHERSELIRDMFGGASGRLQTVRVEAVLTLNAFGFPLRVVMSEQHEVAAERRTESDKRFTIFTFDGERYTKAVRIEGREWHFPIGIAKNEDLDLGGLTGLYAFLPSALRCMGQPSPIGRPRRCAEGDIAFANPGLLSIVIPVLWEEQVNKREFLFFKPAGVGTLPAGLMNTSGWARRERDMLRSISRYFDKMTIEFEAYEEGVEMGVRTVSAWRVEAGGSMRKFWVDAENRVIKVELDPHPRTNQKRWIRMLYPSEY